MINRSRSISHVIRVFVRVSSSGPFFEAFGFLLVEYVFPNDNDLFFRQRLLIIRFFFQDVLSIEWLFKLKLAYFLVVFVLFLTDFTLIHCVFLLYKLKRCLIIFLLFATGAFLWSLTYWVVTACLGHFYRIDAHWVVDLFCE